MLSPWIYNSITSVIRYPLSSTKSQNPVTAQVLSFDEASSSIIIHDKEYFISGTVSKELKEKIIKNKPDYAQSVSNGYLLISNYLFSKANIVDENNTCILFRNQLPVDIENYFIRIIDGDVIKYGDGEKIEDQPSNLLSNEYLSTLIRSIPFGYLSIIDNVFTSKLGNLQYEQFPPFFGINEENDYESDESIPTDQAIDELIPIDVHKLSKEDLFEKDGVKLHETEINQEEEGSPTLVSKPVKEYVIVNQEESIIDDSASFTFSSRHISHNVMPSHHSVEASHNNLDVEMITQDKNYIPVKEERIQQGEHFIQDSEPFPLTQPSVVPLNKRIKEHRKESTIHKRPKLKGNTINKSVAVCIMIMINSQLQTFDEEWEDRWS